MNEKRKLVDFLIGAVEDLLNTVDESDNLYIEPLMDDGLDQMLGLQWSLDAMEAIQTHIEIHDTIKRKKGGA